MMLRSIWNLYKSFFDAVPGQRAGLVIGLLLVLIGYAKVNVDNYQLFILTGAAVVSGIVFSFAGPNFRQLARFKRHKLLPNFRAYLVISYLMTLVSFSLFIFFMTLNLESEYFFVQLIQSGKLSTGLIITAIFSLVFIISFIGFMPRWYIRYPVWLLLIILGGVFRQLKGISIEFVLLFTTVGGIVALACFIYYMASSNRFILSDDNTISLTRYLPGLGGAYSESGVTAVGSILMGISDGSVSRFTRTFVISFLLPVTLYSSALLTGRYSIEQIFTTPQFIAIGLMMGFGMQLHFISSVSGRRRNIWLRIGDDLKQINQIAHRVLARERRSTICCVLIWSAPLMILFPVTSIWIIGVCTLLWSLSLLVEYILLSFHGHPSQRFEFYFLIVIIGIGASLLALSNLHRQPEILCIGAAVIYSPCLFLKAISRLKRINS